MNEKELIDYWIQNTCGRNCWGVLAGGCTGTAFTMKYGDKVQRDKPLTNEMLSMECRKYNSEFSLYVESARWKLVREHEGSLETITNSNDDHSPEGPMVKGLESLVGIDITSANFNPNNKLLRLFFESEDVHLVVSGETPVGVPGYKLYTPGYIVSISGKGQVKYTKLADG